MKSARIGPRKYSLQDFLTFKENDVVQYGRIEHIFAFNDNPDRAMLRVTLFIKAANLDKSNKDFVKGRAGLDHEQTLFVCTTHTISIHWRQVIDRVDIRNSEDYKKRCDEGERPELAGVFVTGLLYDTELKILKQPEDWGSIF